MKRGPMARGKGFDRSKRKPLRRRRDDADTRAADQAYRATVADIRARSGGRCENPLCPAHPWWHCGRVAPHHVRKRAQFGRKRQGERDSASNLILLGASCHRWTDEAAVSQRGRLMIVPEGDEIFLIFVDHRRLDYGTAIPVTPIMPVTYHRARRPPYTADEEGSGCPAPPKLSDDFSVSASTPTTPPSAART